MTAPLHRSVSPRRPGFSLARLNRLVGKELRESLRDRRTLMTLVIMPLLLYPLLGLLFFIFFRARLLEAGNQIYSLGFQNKQEGDLMIHILFQGEQAMLEDQAFAPARESNPSEKDNRFGEPGPVRPQPGSRQPPKEYLPELRAGITKSTLEEDVMEGRIDVGLRLIKEQGKDRKPKDSNRLADWEVLYRSDSAPGRDAVRHLFRVIAASNSEAIRDKHQLLPFKLRPIALGSPEGKGSLLLGALLPLILVLMTITGAVYPAIDLTAGERERGTLEILMAAPIPRLSVLLAKYVAVLTVALLTALINLFMMTITLLILGGGPFLFTSWLAIVLLILEVLGLLLLFAAFFSAVLLSLTSMTRSFKEAQAYLIPLVLVAMVPGFLSLQPGMKLEGINLFVPLLNIVLLARDLLDGGAQPLAAGVVILSTLLYGLAALVLAANIFGRSTVAGT